MNNNDLGDYVNRNSKYLMLADGEVVIAKYIAHKIVSNPYDVEKELVIYELDFKGLGNKYFKSSSIVVANFFRHTEVGDMVEIKREGEGTATKYHLKKIE